MAQKQNPGKKVNQGSACYFFMMEEKENFAKKGFKVDTKEELEAAAVPAWKELLEKEPMKLQKYIDKHNEWERESNKTGTKYKYDQSGRSLDQIKKEDLMKQQEKEEQENFIKMTVENLKEKGNLIQENFYISYFNTICETQEGCHYPCEMSIVEYSIENGLGKCSQEFISPIKIPLGYRYQCNEKSKKTHNIPPDPHDFDLYIEDYSLIFIMMKNFMTSGGAFDGLLPLYVMPNHVEAAEFIVKLITEKAKSDKTFKILKLPQLCHEFLKVAPEIGADGGEKRKDIPSAAQAALLLDKEIYKYWPGLGCNFHEDLNKREELDNNSHCALKIAKALAYSMADICSKPYNISKCADKHFPTENGTDESPSYSTTSKEIVKQAAIQESTNAWGTKVSILAAPAGVSSIPTNFDPNSVELGVGARQFPGLHPELQEQHLPEETIQHPSYSQRGCLFNLSDDDMESVKSVGSTRSSASTATTIRFEESSLAATMSQQPGKFRPPSLADQKRGTLHPLANRPGAVRDVKQGADLHLEPEKDKGRVKPRMEMSQNNQVENNRLGDEVQVVKPLALISLEQENRKDKSESGIEIKNKTGENECDHEKDKTPEEGKDKMISQAQPESSRAHMHGSKPVSGRGEKNDATKSLRGMGLEHDERDGENDVTTRVKQRGRGVTVQNNSTRSVRQMQRGRGVVVETGPNRPGAGRGNKKQIIGKRE